MDRHLMCVITTIALASALLVAFSCSSAHDAQVGAKAQKQEQQAKMVTDPVCGMQIDPAKATAKSDYNGTTYYFCSDYCKRTFDANPKAVLDKTGKK